MADKLDVRSLPAGARESFQHFGATLRELFGDSLLGLSAFGGWLHGDPFYRDTPGRSVVVVPRIELDPLDQLATRGVKLGNLQVAAPLIMTPEYIQASCDAFPLELLEIQATCTVLLGADYFAALEFGRSELRLQCERDLKSELIQLRQGLLAAAGRHKLLSPLCRASVERVVRVMRGVLRLGAKPAAKLAAGVLEQAGSLTSVRMPTAITLARSDVLLDFAGFQRYYGEVASMAEHVDGMP